MTGRSFIPFDELFVITSINKGLNCVSRDTLSELNKTISKMRNAKKAEDAERRKQINAEKERRRVSGLRDKASTIEAMRGHQNKFGRTKQEDRINSNNKVKRQNDLKSRISDKTKALRTGFKPSTGKSDPNVMPGKDYLAAVRRNSGKLVRPAKKTALNSRPLSTQKINSRPKNPRIASGSRLRQRGASGSMSRGKTLTRRSPTPRNTVSSTIPLKKTGGTSTDSWVQKWAKSNPSGRKFDPQVLNRDKLARNALPVNRNVATSNVDYARLANNAYLGKSPGGYRKAGWKRINQHDNKDSGLSASVFRRGKEVVISYRGSEEFLKATGKGIIGGWHQNPDWKANKDARFGKIHPQYQQARELANFYRQKYGDKNVVLTGHSLGGGLASYAGLGTSSKVVTFNASRSKFSIDGINKNQTNIIVNNDPTGDPKTMLGGAAGKKTYLPGKTYTFDGVSPGFKDDFMSAHDNAVNPLPAIKKATGRKLKENHDMQSILGQLLLLSR